MGRTFEAARFRQAARAVASLTIVLAAARAAHGKTQVHDGGLAASIFDVDTTVAGAGSVNTARVQFDGLVTSSGPCGQNAADAGARLQCLFGAMYHTAQITAAGEPSTAREASLSGALIGKRGSSAALAAVALCLADRVGHPVEAVVFPHHVALALPGHSELFELLDEGKATTPAQMRARLGAEFGKSVRVPPKAYLPYYIENLAVRVAEDADNVRAEKLFELAVRVDSGNARVRFDFGTFLLNDSRLPEAIEQLSKSVQLDFRNPDAWANLGVAQVNSGDVRHARESFEHALRLDPTHALARQNLAAIGAQ